MGIVRDFSVDSVANIREIIRKNVDEEDEWAIVDWFKDTFISEELDINDYLDNVSEYQAKMADKHNISSEKFDKILYRVNSVDYNYAQRFSTLQQKAVGFQNKIIGIAALVTPEALQMSDEDYGTLCNNINSQYEAITSDYDDIEKQCEESMPRLDDPDIWEKALNFAGGVASALVIDTVEGIFFVPAIIAGAIDPDNTVDDYLNFINKKGEDADNWIVSNWVTDEESYYYGKTLGDAISTVAGIAGMALGAATILGGITLAGGGTVLCATGVGAVAGAPAIAISAEAVAVGTIELAVAGGVTYSGIENGKNDKEKLDSIKNRELDNPDESKLKNSSLSEDIDKAVKDINNESGTATDQKVFTDNPFDEAGNLKPNINYQTGEFKYNYETDANGRISNWNTDNLQLTKRDGRLNHNPNTPGKIEGDHAGHLAGDRFGGSPELDNIVSQSQNVNLSQYKKIENQWAKAISEGKEVTVNVNIKYDGDGLRPIEFNVEYTIDGDFFSQSILN